jgi:hypothetical protein
MPEGSTGSSRRAALKAGVGVGVGLLAWSGPTITSLGGTPAYAAGCTFVIRISLTGGCRNSDQESSCTPGTMAYHTLDPNVSLPPGFSIGPIIPEGTCCGTFTSTLTFPANLTCTVTIRFNQPPNCAGPQIGNPLSFTSSTGTLAVLFGCPQIIPFPSNGQYQISLACNSSDAPPGCLT